MCFLQFDHICKSYYYSDNEEKILKDLKLEIFQKDMISIMGPSGSGKSTILNILGLLDKQTSGEYYFDGIPTSSLKEKQLAKLRNEKIGFVFQSFNLIQELSVLENVQMSIVISNIHRSFSKRVLRKEMKERSMHIIEQVGLKEYIKKKPTQLSGGQQQRVAIARAIANNPKLILADEPTGALDQENSIEVMNIFQKLNEQGKTIIVVTHDKEVAERCKKNIMLVDGAFRE